MRATIRRLLPVLALLLGACRADPTADAAAATTSETTTPPPQVKSAAVAGETWNASQIDWQPYEAGLAKAKAENKPVCLIFFTTWCPHCKTYSKVFDDPTVVARSRKFVMIHLNADDESALASKYAKPTTSQAGARSLFTPLICRAKPTFN